MTFRALTLEDFNCRVQAREPTPGGGSVSAVVGALAASLGVMTAQFTLGREEFAAVAGDVERLRGELANASAALLALADDDARAYDAFSSAQKLAKATVEEKKTRKAAMQEALRRAADVPLAGMRACRDVLGLLRELLPKSNPHLASDVGTGAHLALAALHGCRLNVQVNLASLQDADAVERLRGEAGRLTEEAEAALRDVARALAAAK